ncbi:MAG: cryptochrome DASH [Planctomycetes bacterium]|nr:cryptochrome DASH [Planctomycetota bacterium]
MTSSSHTVVWFRRDLRIRDHAALIAAARRGPVVCVYYLDEARWSPTSAIARQLAGPRVGAFRTRFLIESLAALRTSLRELGADLLIRSGAPSQGLPSLLREVGASALHFHADIGVEEDRETAAVRDAARAAGVRVEEFWDRTLVPPEDLPFAVAHTPESFSSFRKKIERDRAYAAPLPAPTQLTTAAGIEPGALPTVTQLAGVDADDHPDALVPMHGGEPEAWRRLQRWCWDEDRLKSYKQTRNGMLGGDYSSRFSAWLAHGCISARSIQAEVDRYERERTKNESTYWMTFELLWRDYFQWITCKHGAALFRSSGLQGIPVPWDHDESRFARWSEGQTGFPIVDACMRELSATGFMSNRGRQIVTSFLTKNLGIDWRWGAEWFERLLIDHDVGSNYGNWNYGAGVGNDSRGFRYFNLATQADKYDRRGAHAQYWCPELRRLAPEYVHAPWSAPERALADAGVAIGRSYPAPMVDLEKSAARNRARWERAVMV